MLIYDIQINLKSSFFKIYHIIKHNQLKIVFAPFFVLWLGIQQWWCNFACKRKKSYDWRQCHHNAIPWLYAFIKTWHCLPEFLLHLLTLHSTCFWIQRILIHDSDQILQIVFPLICIALFSSKPGTAFSFYLNSTKTIKRFFFWEIILPKKTFHTH